VVIATLLGRDDDLRELSRHVAAARRDRRARLVRVVGPSGSGTSALVAALPGELRRRRIAHTLWPGRCHPDAPPYFAMIGVLAECEGGVEGWLAEGAPHGVGSSALVSTVLTAGFVRRVRDHLDAAGIPLIIAIDAIDEADSSTLDLVDATLGALADRPLVVVTTDRADNSFRLSSVPHVIELGDLNDDAIVELLGDGAPVDPAERRRLFESLSGRPGHAIAWRDAGGVDGGWERLLRQHGPGAALVVTLAAAVDGHLDPASLGAVAAATPLVVTAMVDAGVLADDAGRVRPAHQLWTDTAARLAPLTAPVARAALDVDPTLPDIVIARLAETCGDRRRAVGAWERVAEQASSIGAGAAAADALQRAIAIGGPGDLVRLGVRSARWSLVAGRRGVAAATADAVVALAPRRERGTRTEAAVIAHRAYFELGDAMAADRALDVALDVCDYCPAAVEALVLDAYRLIVHDTSAAARRTDEALSLADRIDDDVARATALGARALVHSFDGRFHDADTEFVKAIELASGEDDVEARLASNRIYAMWRAGEPLRVASLADVELQRLETRGLGALGDQLALLRAVVLAQTGQLDDARTALATARSVSMAADALVLTDLSEAELDLIVGDTAHAEMLLDRVSLSSGLTVVVGEFALRRSELAMTLGDPKASARAALDGLAQADRGDTLTCARLALAARRAGVDPPELERAPGREGAAIAAELAAHDRPSEIRWDATDTAWAALPAPIERWRASVARADRIGSIEDLSDAERTATEAGWNGLADLARAAQRRHGSRRPGRRTEGALTERERDVLTLVALGLTNKEVAARLGMSPRTVGVHLQRCCSKLNATTRGAAAHQARQLGLISA
jgi:DNA-binding NarL/FixJ family response regulator